MSAVPAFQETAVFTLSQIWESVNSSSVQKSTSGDVWGGVVEECVDNPHAVPKAQLDISLRKFCDRKTSYICQY